MSEEKGKINTTHPVPKGGVLDTTIKDMDKFDVNELNKTGK